MIQRGHRGDGCDLASTLWMYDLKKSDLLVLSWARVRRVRRGSISSDVSIWRRMFLFYVCCNDWVGVCGNVCCEVV